MILEKIVLSNFRQFYGEQEILFSSGSDKNVTLIHAENGVGKTTLLNAVLWCFYGDTTDSLEQSDKMVSLQAVEEEIFEMSVEVFFRYDNREYVVLRKTNEKYGDSSFSAHLIDNGNYEKLSSPGIFVDTVIPREMSRYFFFDGEYAEKFSSINNKAAVRTAVESMLGCNNAVQALKDLASIQRGLEKEIAALTKGDQSSVFQGQIDKLQERLDKNNTDLIILKQESENADSIQREIQSKLRNTAGAKDIQQKREKFVQLKNRNIARKNEIEAQRIKWINDCSIGLLSNKLAEANQEIIENANIQGLIPSKIAETFVKDIIKREQCICDRGFEAGSVEELAIKGLLKEAGSAKTNDRLMEIKTRMGMLLQTKNTGLQEFKSINSQLESIGSEIQECEREIKECGTLLQDSQVSEIVEREKALEKINSEIKRVSAQKSRLEKDCEDVEGNIKGLKEKRGKLLAHNQRARGLQVKMSLLEDTVRTLNAELSIYKEESRRAIIDKVNNILKETARRDYFAQLDENFNLELYYKPTNSSVAKSSGENQLLSLAFIASLVGFSAERRGGTSQLLKPGAMAPLMLDSPFGQLDPSYRLSTAKFLPTLAEQVILMVSKTQGDDDVIKALGEKIGSEYVLISEVKDEQGDKPSDVIRLSGQEIECSVYECDKNMTKIKKIT